MEKEMLSAKVYVSDAGYVCIEQGNGYDDPVSVAVHPEQVPLLIKWLREAAESFTKELVSVDIAIPRHHRTE
jgi:hypothetical protein